MPKQKKKETKIAEELNEQIEAGTSKLQGQRDKCGTIDEQISDDIKEDVIGAIENNMAEIQNEDNADVNIEETEEEIEEVLAPIQDMSLVDATVIPAKLNMRKTPDMLGEVITILPRGEHVTIDLIASEINGFVPANYEGLDGYVKKEFLNY